MMGLSSIIKKNSWVYFSIAQHLPARSPWPASERSKQNLGTKQGSRLASTSRSDKIRSRRRRQETSGCERPSKEEAAIDNAESKLASNSEAAAVDNSEAMLAGNEEAAAVDKAEAMLAGNEDDAVDNAEQPMLAGNEDAVVDNAEQPMLAGNEVAAVDNAEQPMLAGNEVAAVDNADSVSHWLASLTSKLAGKKVISLGQASPIHNSKLPNAVDEASSSASDALGVDFVDIDWSSAPEDGAWAAGGWGPGKWRAFHEGSEIHPGLWHWCLANQHLEIQDGEIDKEIYYTMRDKERSRALARCMAVEVKAIDSFYLPYSFWLEDNKEHYTDPENVILCKLYDEFRRLVYPELCFDIYTPLRADRPPEMLYKLSEIQEQAKAITRDIKFRGNAAMPVPFQWWLDLNAGRMKESAWKVGLGKKD